MKVFWFFIIVINYSVLGQITTVLYSENDENTEPSTSQTDENFSNYVETPTTTDISTSTSDSSTTTFISISSTTEIQCNKDLQISNLTIEPYSFNATVTWDPMEEANLCVEMYQVLVYLNSSEKIPIQNITVTNLTNSLTITNLTACEDYVVKVEVIQKQFDENEPRKSVEDNFKTIPPDPFEYRVKDLFFVRSDNFINATWEPPPEEVAKCVTNYQYYIQEDGETTISGNTSDTSIPELKLKLIGCRYYEITVTPIANEIIDGLPKTTNFSVELSTNAPRLLETEAEKNYINITWQTDNKESNECPLIQMVVTCNATEDNRNSTWIIKHGQGVLNLTSVDPNNKFSMTVDNLSPFTNYTCEGFLKNSGGDSKSSSFRIKTAEDVPSAPNITSVVANSTNINIKWDLPEIIPGNLASYTLKIKNEGPNFHVPDNCKDPDPDNKTEHLYYPSAQETEFNFDKAFPYHNYTISIFGVTGAGDGNVSFEQITTKSSEPDSVRNPKFSNITYSQTDQYSARLTLQFEPPCYINGPFKSYQIIMNGRRNDSEDIIIQKETEQTTIEIDLKPDRHYSAQIWVLNQDFNTSKSLEDIISNPGVPSYVDSVLEAPTSNETTRAYFSLKKSAFDDTNGAILYYALFVLPSSENIDRGDYGFWKDDWPKTLEKYQITPQSWNPFKDGLDTIDFIIGELEDCSSSQNYCNKALKDDTNYTLIVRALTSTTYRDSWPLYFKTDVLDQLDLGLILGLVFGLLALLLITGFMLYLWRRKRKTLIEEEETRFSTSSPTPIPCKKFVEYYNNIRENNNIIKSQYQALGNLGKDIAAATPTTFALLPENRRKNRYTNILPYDTTRVKLNMDEDDEISSDYINASYIKGFSGRNEYIATQGPLEATSKDFWKMVVQENVTIIMMVSQFIEQSKEKCFQYFPNNHETLNFGESLEVRCSTELHFGTHCIRTLQVRKDNEQRNVIHMQFLEWPDFGVPQSTDNMLQFCHQMREKANAEGGLIVVHCSAGVGRTGTLIALDILLQTIDNHRDIDIYKTVLNLRKQRTNMVQTEKQYMFLHTCVHEYLQAPTINSNDQEQDHLYENMDILRSSLKETLIETDVESAL